MELLTNNIWGTITNKVETCNFSAMVAVAYFGTGGATLLPLKKGSLLVVNASENSVKAGQTNPYELQKLYKMGVKIYSNSKLHAKVYVIGKEVIVGSANVSYHSKDYLREVVCISDSPALKRKAIKFIKDNCLFELGEERIKNLSKIYEKPKFEQKVRSGFKKSSDGTLYLAKMAYRNYPKGTEKELEEGQRRAQRKLKEPKHFIEDIHWAKIPPFKAGNNILMITKGKRKSDVSPPGIVTHLQKLSNNKGWFVYVELPNIKKRSLTNYKNALGNHSNTIARGGWKSEELSSILIKPWRK